MSAGSLANSEFSQLTTIRSCAKGSPVWLAFSRI